MADDAVLIAVADDVVDALNSETAQWSQEFTAERRYHVLFDIKDLGELKVSVVPRRLTIQGGTRSKQAVDVEVDVVVQKKVENSTEADGLLAFVQEIGDAFRFKPLGQAVFASMEQEPAYVEEHMVNLVLTSALTLRFKLVR